jgi:hypothetical protein
MSVGEHHDLPVVAGFEELLGASVQQTDLRICGAY